MQKKVSPVATPHACKQFRQKQTKAEDRRKVTFDAARVSFQVEYDIPDDRRLRQKIPVWTEHWKKSKTGLLCQLVRSLSAKQWLKTLLFCISFSALWIQIFQIFKQYLSHETLVSAHYRLPDHFRFPALSLCVPVVVPFVDKKCDNTSSTSSDCLLLGVKSAREVLNASLARVGHRCKFGKPLDVNERAVRVQSCHVLAPSVEWTEGNRKCFTYFSLLSQKTYELKEKSFETQFAKQLAINLIIIYSNFGQNDPNGQTLGHLFVHQSNAIPFETREEAIVVRANRDYEIKYFSTKVLSIATKEKKCANYETIGDNIQRQQRAPLPLSHSDCFSRCLLDEMRSQCVNSGFSADIYRSHCLSRFAPLRHELVETEDKFCTILDNNVCNSHDSYRKSIDQKCRHVCPEDCTRETFHLSVSEHLSNDLSETNVTLVRKLSPDLTLYHVPQTTCTELMARLGGVAAFWLLLYFLVLRFFRLLQYIWELMEIYC